MNTSLFLSISLVGCIGTAAAVSCATAALAQGEQHIPASGYCTGATVQISGWETDLVKRNKGLEKFHWSAINTVQHYQYVAPGSAQKTPMKPLTAYHNVKPTVISTWSDPHARVPDKTCIANADNSSRASVNARLRGANPSVCAQMRSYEPSSNSYQQAQYGGERSTDSQVSGRVMHY
jgi:hypothetical protein